MTCNLHSLHHLPDVIGKFGPLPMTSCFSYEDLNGSFERLVRGTRYAQLQICSALCKFNNVIELSSEISESENSKKFRKKLELCHLRRRKLMRICDNCFIIGAISKCDLSESLRTTFVQSNINLQAPINTYKFLRLFKNNIAYDSECYKREKKKRILLLLFTIILIHKESE